MYIATHKKGKLFTFLCLYIAQSIPMSFFSTVLPVIMRQNNFSLETIGLLQLMKLPWILKFLWSPGIDRTAKSLNDYKRWIFSSELIYAAIIFAISFMSIQATPHLVLGLIVLSFIASATQDIATDALAVLSFSKKDKSMVNSMQSIGSFAGAMIGGGLLLLMYEWLGWGKLLPFLALFVVIALLPLFIFTGRANNTLLKEHTIYKKPSLDDWLGFFKQKGIYRQVIFLFFFYAGLIGILAMLKPMLVDYGYTIKEIGIMSGVIGTSVGSLAAFAGGFIVRKIGIHRSRIIFAGLVLLSTVYFFLMVNVLPINIATLHLGICLLWGSYGLATIIVYTTAMESVRPGYEGTDFTIQTVITHFSGIVMGVSSGKIAGAFSYSTLFVIEMCIAAFSLLFILSAFNKKKTFAS